VLAISSQSLRISLNYCAMLAGSISHPSESTLNTNTRRFVRCSARAWRFRHCDTATPCPRAAGRGSGTRNCVRVSSKHTASRVDTEQLNFKHLFPLAAVKVSRSIDGLASRTPRCHSPPRMHKKGRRLRGVTGPHSLHQLLPLSPLANSFVIGP
jgi:hypothetical protein